MTLLGAAVELRPKRPGDPVLIENIRAKFERGIPPSITLEPLPLYIEPYAEIIDTAQEFEKQVIHCLAHEVCHLRQWQNDPGLYDEDGLGTKASALSTLAHASRLYSDYLDYVQHPLELEAHATQLAAEIISEDGKQPDLATFAEKAMLSWVCRHITDNPDFERTDGDEARAVVLMKMLIAEAWIAHNCMLPG